MDTTRLQRPLRIAQIAPLYESVPPALYGGTERVVSYITEELVARGHEVSLFAAGDSTTAAKLMPGCDRALRRVGKPELGSPLQLLMLAGAYEMAPVNFDIVHSHVDYWVFPFAQFTGVPTISTMHNRLDLDEFVPFYRRYPRTPLVSISDAQRAPLPDMNWHGTVYHGLPRNLLKFNPKPQDYLAFVGRISPEKGIDRAIAVAEAVNVPLKIAAKVDAADRQFYEAVIKPLIKPPLIEYIGEITEAEKSDFLGNAIALIFAVDWPEPFGLAMIEALACGTPVIARPCGSVPEIIRPGITGFLGCEVEDLANGVRNVTKLSRERCRREFEERFTSEIMTQKYEQIYLRIIERKMVTALPSNHRSVVSLLNTARNPAQLGNAVQAVPGISKGH